MADGAVAPRGIFQPDAAIPDRYRVACEFCHGALDVRDHGVYQHTAGWVMNRAGGGGHAVSLPLRDPRRWAHGPCVERMTAGTFAQRSLLGDVS
jgi:hypothetical protein